MKMSNQRLINTMTFLNVLQVDGKDADGNFIPRKMPVKLVFAVRKNRKALQSHLEDYEETRTETLKRYAKTDKAGELIPKDNQAQFKSDKDRATYAEEHLKLLTTKIDVNIHNVTEATIEEMGQVEEHIVAGLEFMTEGWAEEEEEVELPVNGQVEADAE